MIVHIDRDMGDECTCDQCTGFGGEMLTLTFNARRVAEAIGLPFIEVLNDFVRVVERNYHGCPCWYAVDSPSP